MKILIDIPDSLYRELKAKAANDDLSLNEWIVLSVEREMRSRQTKAGSVTPPIIQSKRPGTLNLDNDKIFEIIRFP